MSFSLKTPEGLPTHAQLVDFFNKVLPPNVKDIPLLYHVPRWPGYNASKIYVHDIVLSVTPTLGVYAKLRQLARGTRKAVCFLHRPFQLDRKALPKGSLVLANHKRFDELLTVGYNLALASRLGMVVERATCIQGYKGDPERRIGIVGPLGQVETLENLAQTISAELCVADIHKNSQSTSSQTIQAVALMNAFGPDEVSRVILTTKGDGLILEEVSPRSLLYLTGQPRDLGLRAAETFRMPSICVGHRPAEEWGIRYLESSLHQTWPNLAVHTVFEDESPPETQSVLIEAKS
ncbi:uncharacterized protein JN550_007560 [Neoarthrinium moseri]|uniref:uncharacterized protein n=1 Tax=Neoarthrinium moseri TaxID=1658444 RepID=UPI001FDB8A92|nr:uncharacterized protein JN550_007560 [Neoarthrinium moseri]KAI1866707.1 hypothetical protein JN550_007560 [Neoarthrinium moseri]